MSWKPEFLFLILLSTCSVFFTAHRIRAAANRQRKKRYIIACVILNLAILAFFKYANFISESLLSVFELIRLDIDLPYLHIILPVGISFYTFQAISYIIDVYTGEIEPEKHLGIFATYIAFFPQLVAGPIERAAHLLPQFREEHLFRWDNIRYGLQLMLRGFFQKVVIADRIAVLVNPIFSDVMNYTGIGLLVAVFLFGIQIYCDFSGYTDIARGAAKMMGFDLMKNFNRPYFARSVADFRRRWHISLSTWFRDYVYIPLGGNRVSKKRWTRNIMWTFLLSGLRHGANWTFVVWGGLHGLAIIGERLVGRNQWSSMLKGKGGYVIHMLQIIFIFIVVQLFRLFFRVETFTDGRYILMHMFDTFSLPKVRTGWGPMGAEFRLVMVFMLLLFMKECVEEYGNSMMKRISKDRMVLAWYLMITLLIVVFMIKGQEDFIYFQF